MEKEKILFDFKKLEKEQEKLSKLVDLKDKFDFDLAEKIGGVSCGTKGKFIVCCIIVMKDNSIIEQKYSYEKTKFPYIAGLRAYRDLPVILKVLELIENKPDVLFINASGICHPRKFGLASHLAISTGIPTIGISESLLCGEEKEGKVYLDGEIVAEKIITKEGAKPIYISPGSFISLESAVKITKKFVKKPHKLPEPLRKSKKYLKKILKEIIK